jgi:hypothetical protein
VHDLSFETPPLILSRHLDCSAYAAIYPFRFMALEGGLVSYGVDLSETFPRALNMWIVS